MGVTKYLDLTLLTFTLVVFIGASINTPVVLGSAQNVKRDSAPPSGFINVRKCCGLQEYYNVTLEECKPLSTTLGTSRWLDVDFQNRSAIWEPPSIFLNFFSRNQQSLSKIRFDSKFVGKPNCRGRHDGDKSTRLEVVDLPKDEDWYNNATVGRDWEGDWANKTNYLFLPQDPMLIEGNSANAIYHDSQHFCVDLTEKQLILLICSCSDEQRCIRKCCPPNQHLTFTNDDVLDVHECVPDEGPKWELPLHSKPGVLLSAQERKKLQLRYSVGFPSCMYVPISSGWWNPDYQMVFIINPNGTGQLFDRMMRTWSFQTAGSDQCFDNVVMNSTKMICPGEAEIMIYCLDGESEPEPAPAGIGTFFTILLVIATTLLLITAIVVALLLETKNIHSWTRVAYVLSHFTFFLLLGLTHVEAIVPSDIKSCQAVAVVIHFAGLATTCWLSVINFDLWWTFKVLKPTSGVKLDIRRFVWYLLFALGIPTIIISIALGIQSQDPGFTCRADVMKTKPIVAQYAGDRGCSLSENARPAYWFGPLFILLMANLVFFLATTYRISGLQRLTRRASVGSTSRGQTQSRQIFIKIFIVSGVTWWIEIFQWIFKNAENSLAWYWLVLDMIHCIQAITLFVIFVCKRDVLRNLQTTYPILKKVLSPMGTSYFTGPGATTSAVMSGDPNSISYSNGNKRKVSFANSASNFPTQQPSSLSKESNVPKPGDESTMNSKCDDSNQGH